MPDWFGPNAGMGDRLETTRRDVSVRTSIRLEKCYLKHGTSIAVRLFFIDKVVGGAIPVTIQRASIRELLGALTVPQRSAITTVSPPAPKRSSGLYLIRPVKSQRAAPRRQDHRRVGERSFHSLCYLRSQFHKTTDNKS